MNWKVILQLSMFGLIMAFGTIALIPQKAEPVFWVIIFIICGYLIAKATTGQYFLQGWLLSIFNSVWITAAHIIFYNTYIAHHPDMAKMSANMPMRDHPRLLMLIMAPFFGAASGLIQGSFAYIASKLVKKTAT